MTAAEEQKAKRKQEICSLYALAYQKDFNKSLNGSNMRKRSSTGSLYRESESRDSDKIQPIQSQTRHAVPSRAHTHFS